MPTRGTKTTVEGHKCLGISVMVHVNCECGWSSPNCKSRKDAYSEWRHHARSHAADMYPSSGFKVRQTEGR